MTGKQPFLPGPQLSSPCRAARDGPLGACEGNRPRVRCQARSTSSDRLPSNHLTPGPAGVCTGSAAQHSPGQGTD